MYHPSERYLSPIIRNSLSPKITLLSGPRQVGKTTLAKALLPNAAYYNYDNSDDKRVFLQQAWDRSTPLVIFDELHKKRNWKLWLKGLYDNGIFNHQFALVTGSARLSHLKKVGDSLAGRFYEYRLHPLDLKELKGFAPARDNLKRLLERGGFPEPFFTLSLDESRKWRRSHSDVILRQDLLTLEVVKDLDSMEVLIELLSTRVGSTVSYNSLAEDLKISDLTVKRWLRILEDLYIVFRVSAYSKNIVRGLSKAGKYYFYDIGKVQTGEGEKFENLVALALRKELDFLEDTKGLRTKLHFLRNKQKKEIDFFVQVEGARPKLIEAKLSDGEVSENFRIFGPQIPTADQIQLVANLDRRFDARDGVRVENAANYLENLSLI